MNKFSVVLLSLLTMVVGAFAGPYDAWSHYREVTINTTNSGGGANVAGTVTNFPVLIRLTNASDAAGADVLAAALAGGADLRFATADGQTALSYEIERWTATAAEIWVRVPSVSGSAATGLRMYWGKGDASSESNGGNVFRTDDSFVGAWHMGNAGGMDPRPASVTGAPAAVMRNYAGGQGAVQGVIGLADTLRGGAGGATADPAAGNYIDLGRSEGYVGHNYSGFSDFTTGFSYSLWYNQAATVGFARLLALGNDSGAATGNSGTGRALVLLNQSGLNMALRWSSTGTAYNSGAGYTVNNEWTQMFVTKGTGTGTITVYKNGASFYTATNAAALGNTTRNWAMIGRSLGANNGFFQGKIDNVTLAKTQRSADYVKLSYETQKATATAVTLGVSAVTPAFEYALKDLVVPTNAPITDIAPAGIHAISSVTVQPLLPAGLSLNAATGVVSGSPTGNTARTEYIFTADLATPDVTIIDTIYIRTATPIAGLAYAMTTFVFPVGGDTTITAPQFTGQVDSFTVSPALPAGLVLNGATGAITGAPVASAAATNHTVTAHNPLGNSTQVLNITVLATPGTPTYSQNPVTVAGGLAAPIAPLKATVTGSQLKWSVTPALPAGLTFDTLTGTITGTPPSASTGIYTVSASNIAGTSTVNVNLTVTAPEDYGTWTGTAEYHLNAGAAGATTQQTGYPLLVRLTSAHAALFAAANADGSDIRFSKADGTRLAYELESWNQAGTAAAFWVRLDTLPASGTVALRIHYDNDAATSLSSGSRVFNTASGFQAVWHMNGGTGNESDVTANAFAATAVNAPATLANGAIGSARAFDGVNQRFDVPGSAGSILSFPVNGNYTLSAWALFNETAPAAQWRTIIAKHDNEYALSVSQNQTQWQFVQYSNNGWSQTNANKTNQVWQLVTSVKNGAATTLYVNGVPTAGPNSDPSPAGRNLGSDVTLGARPTTAAPTTAADRYWKGNLDELRMANVSHSADWIKLDYETQVASAAPISGLTYSSNTYTFLDNGQAITPVPAPTLQVGSATAFSISPALPPDLSLNTATGAITGTPTNFMPATSFVVTARSGAWVTSQTLTLEISPTPPSNIVYGMNPAIYEAGLVVSANTPTNDGTITGWSVSPALPAGLTINALTGAISGEPTVASAEVVYVVTGTGPEGSTTANVTITVLPPSEDFSTWAEDRDIVLNTSASGADVSGTVTNFPVLVRLGQAEAAIFSQALAGGADVRFAKANGVTRLPYEIVSWDAVAHTAEIWVKVDSVHGNNPTQSVKMFWGKSGAADSSAGPKVFAASNGYVTAFHMGNPVGDPATTVRPNSVNPGTNDATPAFIGAHPDVVTKGVIGMADTLRGQGGAANGDHFSFGSLEATNYPNGLTLSMWAKPTSYTGNFVQFYTIGNISGGNGVSAQTVWMGKRAGGNDFSGEVAGSTRIDGGSGTAALNEWQHYSYSVLPGGAGSRLYRNGVEIAQTTSTQNLASVARTSNFIGRANWGDNTFNGVVDEVRFSNTARSADFVKLEYQNQNKYQALTNIGYQAPVIAFATDSVNAAAGFAIPEATLSITGTVTAPLSIDPPVPAGLTFNTATGSITGTPDDVYPSTAHVVTATNNGATDTDTIIITVVPPTLPSKAVIVAPVFNAADVLPSSLVIWNKVAPPVTNYLLQGSDDSTFATVDFDTVVTDTSFSLSFAPYNSRMHVRVRANNIAGSGDWSDSVSFTTAIAPPMIAYMTPRSLIKGAADSLVVTSTGGAVASYSVSPALPAGLTLNATTGRIDGTPTVASAAALYSVVATNTTGTDTVVVSIAVVDLTPVFAYASTTLSFTRNVEITTQTPTSTGGAVTAWNVSPALPAGLAFSATTGAVSGTPTAAALAADYRVIGTNAHGADTATLNITVLPGLPVIAYAGSPESFIKGVADSSLVTSTGGTVASYSVTPALPAGLTLNATTGRLGGTPTAASAAANYSVIATNASGNDTAVVNITVLDLTPVISYAAVVDSFTVAIPVVKNATSTGGTVTAWSVSPALPAGLAFSTTTGNISGAPTTAAAVANYTVIATNAYGADTVVLNLKVLQPTAIMGGAYTFRVSGVEKPYTFVLPAGAATTEKVTMRITDVWGRTIWTKAVRPGTSGAATEVEWTGRTATGMLASAGMYVVRISVLDNGKTTDYVRKSVTLKSR